MCACVRACMRVCILRAVFTVLLLGPFFIQGNCIFQTMIQSSEFFLVKYTTHSWKKKKKKASWFYQHWRSDRSSARCDTSSPVQQTPSPCRKSPPHTEGLLCHKMRTGSPPLQAYNLTGPFLWTAPLPVHLQSGHYGRCQQLLNVRMLWFAQVCPPLQQLTGYFLWHISCCPPFQCSHWYPCILDHDLRQNQSACVSFLPSAQPFWSSHSNHIDRAQHLLESDSASAPSAPSLTLSGAFPDASWSWGTPHPGSWDRSWDRSRQKCAAPGGRPACSGGSREVRSPAEGTASCRWNLA